MHAVIHTVEPRISGPRLSGNLAIRTDFGGNGFLSLCLYSHIRKFALPYPDNNFGHQMTNSFAKMSRKSGTPGMIAFLMFMFWFSEIFINNLHNFVFIQICHIHDILSPVLRHVSNLGRKLTISSAKVNQPCDRKIASYPPDTRRNNNVIMTLKRRHDVVLTS